MSKEVSFKNRLERLPVPILPTFVGVVTLGNVFAAPLGYTWIRHISTWAAIVIWFCYLFKIFLYPKTCLKEYNLTVPCSLYAGFTMILMLVSAYLFTYVPWLGKGLWLIAIIVHAIHILVFTYLHVFENFNINNFVPSWFVTYNGIMVAAVVGKPMNMPLICTVIVYYGIIIFAIMLPFMIYRLLKYPIQDGFYHTRAIVLAPSSLCLVTYINIIENKIPWVVYILYFIVFCCLIFVVLNLNKFFSFTFHPGFAGMTFPMAIGIVASIKMATYLIDHNIVGLGNIITQISGIQIYMTTAIIAFVLHNFFIMLYPYKKEKESVAK